MKNMTGSFVMLVNMVPMYMWKLFIVRSQPKITVNNVTRQMMLSHSVGIRSSPSYSSEPFAWRSVQDLLTWTTHSTFTTDTVIEVTQGSASGPNGRMDNITCPAQWITNDVTNDITILGPLYNQSLGVGSYLYGQGVAVVQQRTVTVRTDLQMQTLMNAYLASGTIPAAGGAAAIPAVPATYRIVAGGHVGYKVAIKSKGDVHTRYKVDYNVGDTITINDIRLGVVFTGVVSGATETIDGSGYTVNIELGMLGATVEQRLNKTI